MKREATLYRDVAREIRRAVENGELRAGQKLAPILSLSEQHGVSHTTIRAALRELSAQGLVESRQGSGVYVRQVTDGETTGGDLGRHRLLACLMPGEGTSFFADLMRGIERVARDGGFRVLFVNTRNSMSEEARQLQELSTQVAGFLVVPVAGEDETLIYAALSKREVPVVFVDRRVRGVRAPSVSSDNELGGFLATEHLLKHARGPIWALAESGPTSMEERVAGFERAISESGRVLAARQIRRATPGLLGPSAGYSLACELIEEKPCAPFGLVAMNEGMARGAYAALKEGGLQIPHDVAVVGIDDNEAVFFDPPLSAVRQDFCDMGARGAKLLLERVHFGAQGREQSGRGRRANPTPIRLKPRLVVRNSSDSESDFSLSNHLRVLMGDGKSEAFLTAK